MRTKKFLLALVIALVVFFGLLAYKALAATVLIGSGGGTGHGTSIAADIGKCLKVSGNSPLTYSFSACGGGGGTWGSITGTLSAQTDLQAALDAKFTLPSLTSGSVVFSNGSTLVQDNGNFFFDDSNNRLGLGTATPAYTLDIVGTAIRQSSVTTDATNKSFKFLTRNFTNAQNDFLMVFGQSKTSANTLILGGGQTGSVAATTVAIFTGAGNNTDTGTARLTVDASGNVLVSSLTASKLVFTDGSKNLTSTGIGTSGQFIKGDGSLDSTTYLSTIANLTATNTSLTFSGTYDGTVARTIGLNLGNANTWTGQQTFNTTMPIFGSITGSTQCLHVDTTGLISGTGSDCGSGGSGITVGTTSITSGTNTRVLYNNSGVVGEYTVSGSGNVAMTTSPVFTTPNIGSATGSISGNAGTATALAAGRTISISGDLTYTSPSFDGSGNVTAAGTLATVNSNVGTFGSATKASVVTVNGKGLVTAASESTVTPAVGSITGLGTGVGTWLATPSSANLITATTDETGSGALVFGTSPIITLNTASTAVTQTPGDNSTKVANTAYVDAATQGTDFKEAAVVATTANLVGLYSNGTAGVGATFIYTATGTDTIDGVTLALGNRVLVKNQSTTFQNGVYDVTTAGAIGVAGILTRSADFNQAADIDAGDTIFVISGTVGTNTTWVYTGVTSPVMGTDAITFSQIGGPGSITSGNGITVTGLSIAIDTSVTVDKTTAQTLTNKSLTTPKIASLYQDSIGGSNLLTMPAATDTLVGKATTDTFTNKTYDTAGSGNSFSINGVAVTANTGTGAVARASSPVFTTPSLGAATATTINGNTFTTGSYTLTGTAAKTLNFTASLTLSGTDATIMTFPSSSATIARTDVGQTFTGVNTFAGTSNTATAFNVTDGTNSYFKINTQTATSTASAFTFAQTAPSIASTSSSAYIQTTFTPGTYTFSGTTNTTQVNVLAPLGMLHNQLTVAGNGTRSITEASNVLINGAVKASSSSGTETIITSYGLQIPAVAVTGTGGAVTTAYGLFVGAPTGAGTNIAAGFSGHLLVEGVTSTGATGTGKFVFDAAPTITGHETIEGVTATGATGTGKFVFDTAPQISRIGLNQASSAGIALDATVDGTTITQGLRVQGHLATDLAFSAFVTSDSFVRFTFQSDGLMNWGSGALAGDTDLYRSAADTLKTDDSFIAAVSAGIGAGLNSSAKLNIAGGSTTVAPLIINSGTNLTVTVGGAIENNGTHLFYTATNGGTRFQLDQQSAASGLTVATSVITGGSSTNILYNNAGVLGEYTTTGSGTVVVLKTAPTFTTSITTPSVLATANDSGALGASGTAFSDLFLASGGVINFNAGNATLTHSAGLLTSNVNIAVPDDAYASTWDASVNVPTKNAVFDAQFYNSDVNRIYTALGSAILFQTFGSPYPTSSLAVSDGKVAFQAVYINRSTTITGIKFPMFTNGSYTADNNTKIGLYSYSGGTLTLVASCANDATLFSTGSGTVKTKAFSTPYSASPGVFFIALLLNDSAVVTNPTIGIGSAMPNNAQNNMDFTNSAGFGFDLASQTDLPASTTASVLSIRLNPYILYLY